MTLYDQFFNAQKMYKIVRIKSSYIKETPGVKFHSDTESNQNQSQFTKLVSKSIQKSISKIHIFTRKQWKEK
jgi:hypothetical protein